jgi:hypothetical protein
MWGVGRNFAGIHWRADCQAGLLLGEAVAISLLRDQSTSSRKPSMGSSHEIQWEQVNCAKLKHPTLDADVAEVQLKDSNRGRLVCSMEPKKRQDIFGQARKTLSVGGG